MINVIIADDSAAFRKAMCLLLETTLDIRVVGEAKNGRQAVRLSASLHPHVVVMDIGMPVLNGLRATRLITDYFSKIRVLILSAHLDEEYAEEAIRCGAQGYLLKDSVSAVLPQAIREIEIGGSYFDPPISSRLRAHYRDRTPKTMLSAKP